MAHKTNTKTNVVYIAKKMLEHAKNGNAVMISTPSKNTVSAKNKTIELLLDCYKKAGKKVIVANYDSAYLPSDSAKSAVFNAVSIADAFSLHLDQMFAQVGTDNDLVLVNVPPITSNAAVFDKSIEIDHIVLDVQYGRTKYVDFEKAIDILAENNITVLGVIANKY